MQASTTQRRAAMRGITLIELMIVVTIIAVIAIVAYPSYQEQVQRARRSDGQSALLDTAQRLERCYTRFGRYDHADCDVTLPFDTAEAFYEISAVGDIEAAAFTLAATPQNGQTADTDCGVLRLTSAGEQGSRDSDTDSHDCW